MNILAKNTLEKNVIRPDEENWDESVMEANKRSWFFNPDEPHPFVGLSVESAGAPRNSELGRIALARNMSPNFGDLAIQKEEWAAIAESNVARFLKELKIPPEKVKIVRPQADYRDTKDPMDIINVDSVAFDLESKAGTSLQKRADFAYTRDMSTVLAIRPADCPIITALGQTKEGPIYCMTHIPWPGADSKGCERGNYIDQMFAYYKELGIGFGSLRLNVSCGARAKSYSYSYGTNPLEGNPGKELLFKNVTEGNDGAFHFNIDTPVFIRDQLLKHGLDEYQIFQDTTDTASQECGHSSHSRAKNNERKGIATTNTRDILVASPTDYPNL